MNTRSAARVLAIAAVLAAVIVIASVAVAAALRNPAVTVVRVVDGDTLIADIDGEETTVRLLNIDAPETKHPDEPVQCLGPEASDFLAERLPAGTTIDLEYDEERHDQYGRTLAGVFESDSLVNAEIAEEGLGLPVVYEPNDRFYDDVVEASLRAQGASTGLFAADIACTPASAVQAQTAMANQLPTAALEVDPADALAVATTLVEESAGVVAALDPEGLVGAGFAVYAAGSVQDHMDELREEAGTTHSVIDLHAEALTSQKSDYDAEQKRLAEEAAQKAEEERLAKEAEEKREAEEAAAREAEEQEKREAGESSREEKSETKESPKESSGGSSDSSGPSGSSGESSSCVPYGPVHSYSDSNGYTGKRHGMPGGTEYRKCS